jgi:predicted RNA-binding protein with TRAM domain
LPDGDPAARATPGRRTRPPGPVAIGETDEFGVTEFTDHHSGDRIAVGTVEGFVVFTADVPASVEVGDVVRARLMSFDRGRTSADATFVERD